MAWPVKKPPSGIPAGGPGWGGKAKGAGKPGKAPRITAETASAIGSIPKDKSKRAERVATAEELKLVLTTIALDDDGLPMARIQAADKLLDRIEGKPGPAGANDDGEKIIKIIGGLPDDD